MECHPTLSQLIIVPLQSQNPQQKTLLCGGKSLTQKPTCRRTLLTRLFSFAILAIPLWMLVVVAKDKEEFKVPEDLFVGETDKLTNCKKHLEPLATELKASFETLDIRWGGKSDAERKFYFNRAIVVRSCLESLGVGRSHLRFQYLGEVKNKPVIGGAAGAFERKPTVLTLGGPRGGSPRASDQSSVSISHTAAESRGKFRAEPKCPSCGEVGEDYIVARFKKIDDIGSSDRILIIFCSKCGYIYSATVTCSSSKTGQTVTSSSR